MAFISPQVSFTGAPAGQCKYERNGVYHAGVRGLPPSLGLCLSIYVDLHRTGVSLAFLASFFARRKRSVRTGEEDEDEEEEGEEGGGGGGVERGVYGRVAARERRDRKGRVKA